MDVMKLLPDRGMSVNLNSTRDATTLHVSVACGSMEEKNRLSKEGLL